MPRRSNPKFVVSQIREQVRRVERRITRYYKIERDKYLREILTEHSRNIVSIIDDAIRRQYETT